jgi:hypothetical protein
MIPRTITNEQEVKMGPSKDNQGIAGRRGRDQGVALIIVLLSMVVLSVLAATIIFTARAETFASYNYKLDTQADYLAKAGIQQGIAWLRSSRYTVVPQAQAGTYYNVTSSGAPLNLYTANNSPVQCVSGCTTTTAGSNQVQFIGYGSGSSNYPISGVAANFANDLVNVRVTGDSGNSGTFSVNAILLSYQTVSTGSSASYQATPMETWLVTSRATWTGTSGGNTSVATAEEQAVIQPLYVATNGNALYGYCSVSMAGSAGTCTDAYNSSMGAYAGGNNHTAAAGCDSNSTNVIAAGAGVGANGGVSLGSNVTVAGNVTLGNTPTAGCSASGYSGNPSSVLGQVVTGPHVNPPASPTFRSGFPGTAPSYGLGSGSVQILPLSVSSWPTTFPDATHAPPLTSGGPCMDTTCNGTYAHPYEINSISMTGGGHGGNAPVLDLIGGPDIFNPVYYDVDSFSQNQGQIMVSGYVVINIRSSFSMAGLGITNNLVNDIPPACVQINYAGTNTASISGNGAISAVITAPNATVSLGGGGSAGYMVGSIQANNVSVQGGYPIHYDVQLSRLNGQLGILVVSAYSRRKM